MWMPTPKAIIKWTIMILLGAIVAGYLLVCILAMVLALIIK